MVLFLQENVGAGLGAPGGYALLRRASNLLAAIHVGRRIRARRAVGHHCYCSAERAGHRYPARSWPSPAGGRDHSSLRWRLFGYSNARECLNLSNRPFERDPCFERTGGTALDRGCSTWRSCNAVRRVRPPGYEPFVGHASGPAQHPCRPCAAAHTSIRISDFLREHFLAGRIGCFSRDTCGYSGVEYRGAVLGPCLWNARKLSFGARCLFQEMN